MTPSQTRLSRHFFPSHFFLLILIGTVLTNVCVAQDVPIKDLKSIRALDPNEAAGKLVDFEATVTFVSGMHEFIFVEDQQEAIFVHRPEVAKVRAGQRVRVRGRLAKGDLLPIVAGPKVTVIGDSGLPTAEKINDIGVEHDCRYLEFEFKILLTNVGLTETVLFAKTESNKDVCIQVSHDDGISLPNSSRLTGQRVKVTGALGLQLTGGAFIAPGMEQNQIVGYKILCNSSSDIETISDAPMTDVAAAETVGLKYLAQDDFPETRFLTFGQICLIDYTQPRGFVIGDDSTFIRANLQTTEYLQPGMMVRIGGTKTIDKDGNPQFDVQYVFRIGISDLPQPETISVEKAVADFSPNRRITVEGTPLRVEKRSGRPYLIIGDKNWKIAVQFQDDAMGTFASLDPSVSSKVRVTGISRKDYRYNLQLVVARSNDAVLVESKTSISRIVAISLGILLIVCALAALWIKLLRSQVAQKQRFESIFDNAGCPIIVFNGDLQLVDANQVAADMTGFSKEELRGMSISQLDTHLPPEEIRQMLIQAMNSREVAIFRTKIQTKTNQLLDVEVHTRNLTPSEDREKATYIAVFPDITARNEYEHQLKTARDEAIRADKAKSRFLASMSHELRTPLNGVIGMTQLLESTELTPIQTDYLSACRTSGQTLLTVIGDVLDFSKMEAGKLELAPKKTQLIPFLENIVRATSLQQKTQHIDLASFVDPRLSRSVMVDGDRLRQVIFNLIGNAAKFTEHGSVTVTARCKEVNRQHADVRFVVADTGIGIPDEQVSRLFEAFEQCDTSTTRQYGGTGLGLAICKQIVELMGGSIHVESTLGEGSRFMVDVRLHFAPLAEQDHTSKHGLEDDFTVLRVAAVGMSAPITELLHELFAEYKIEASFLQDYEVLPHDEFDVVLLNNEGDLEAVRQMFAQQPALLSNAAPILIPVIPANCIIDLHQWESLGAQKPLHKPLTQTRLLQALHSQRAEEPTKVEQSPKSNFQVGGLRILVCEDVPVNQMFAKEICRQAGIECVVCDNGEHGIETLQLDNNFDVIFMDCHMPIMDGFEATKRIRAMHETGSLPRIPIVALTANAVVGDRDKCLKAGMDDYLSKPFEIEQFIGKIRSHTRTPALYEAKVAQTRLDSCDEAQLDATAFDIDKLLSQINDRVFVMEIAEEFAETLPMHRATLENCLQQKDPVETFKVAHRLKGSAGTVKAERISKLASEMESTARDGQLDKLEVQIVNMLQEFENFTNAVRDEFSKNDTAAL